MQDGGVIPTSGFPRDGGTAKEGHRKDDLITEQTMHLIQHMHSVHGRRLGVIPSKRAFSERFESSREVVVHGDGRGTRDLGNGSRTCPERNLSHPRYSGVVEVVVHVRFSERYLTNPTSSGRRKWFTDVVVLVGPVLEKMYLANPRSRSGACGGT